MYDIEITIEKELQQEQIRTWIVRGGPDIAQQGSGGEALLLGPGEEEEGGGGS